MVYCSSLRWRSAAPLCSNLQQEIPQRNKLPSVFVSLCDVALCFTSVQLSWIQFSRLSCFFSILCVCFFLRLHFFFSPKGSVALSGSPTKLSCNHDVEQLVRWRQTHCSLENGMMGHHHHTNQWLHHKNNYKHKNSSRECVLSRSEVLFSPMMFCTLTVLLIIRVCVCLCLFNDAR